MVLGNEDIKKCIRTGEIEITPKLKKDQITQAAIDITISDEFYVPKQELYGTVVDASEVDYTSLYNLEKTDTILLKPGEMILCRTVERIKLGNGIIGFMDGRSRFARIGLAVHVTSSIIQPGSELRQVLEIVNLSGMTIKLKKGMRISQVTFARLENPTSKPYRKVGSFKDNK